MVWPQRPSNASWYKLFLFSTQLLQTYDAPDTLLYEVYILKHENENLF